MIHVVHIVPGLQTGGAEMMLLRLVAASDRGRFRHSVVSLRGEDDVGSRIRAADVPLHCLGMRPGIPSFSGLLRLHHVIRRARPNVLQGWMYHGSLAASVVSLMVKDIPLAVAWNIRLSIGERSDLRLATRLVIRLLGRWPVRPACIINNSLDSAQKHHRLGYRVSETVVISNGFDCERFAPRAEARSWLRRELGLRSDALVVVHVGRYHKQKNHLGFVKAAARVRASIPGVHFLLVGPGVDAKNVSLCDAVAAAGLIGCVSLWGARSDMAEILAGVDVLCNASHVEGFPNVVGEDMACGVPCVVTDVGDSRWLVGETGVVVQPGDAAALGNGLLKLLLAPQAERSILGEQARQRIVQDFGLDEVVSQYEELYQRLSNKPAARV